MSIIPYVFSTKKTRICDAGFFREYQELFQLFNLNIFVRYYIAVVLKGDFTFREFSETIPCFEFAVSHQSIPSRSRQVKLNRFNTVQPESTFVFLTVD